MADFEAIEAVATEAQFWNVLTAIVSAPCPNHESLDNALRAWLYLVAKGRDNYLDSEDDIASCSQKLKDSSIFRDNCDYVRTQIIYSLLQEDELGPLHVIANFLLLDGRTEEATFRRMIGEGCFGRLLDLIRNCANEDRRLHRLLLELMYEMSRIERLRAEDLLLVDDGFVAYLFGLIESLSDDAHDPYHYPVIRVLLVLNEQYMVASTSAAVSPASPSAPLTNRVVKILSMHGDGFRTFGENIILLLNRETETALQLLILKLLYLLFTTNSTCEYFYTNDLRVLLDVIIRNLLDLPSEMNVLRHTYLRVLAPLLAHTQLSHPPHYKRDQILSLLDCLRGSGNAHFTPPDPTTMRLIERVGKTPWLVEDNEPEKVSPKSPLGSLSLSQSGSAVSIIANVSEKPGVQTPSRKADSRGPKSKEAIGNHSEERRKPSGEHHLQNHSRTLRPQRSLPEVPKHRHGVPVPPLPMITTLHINGGSTKKSPPKLPPPRRHTKLRNVTTGVVQPPGSTTHS
ncbi:hypothetical protein QBC34DRAFT_399149 [Podospora aff. communis PSN243]|uniref:SPIN90/Ldb17 leucine-rich domain-containing protein n=1 Tax=Podospora aff. communis PSN243 TaxID=3040156 RepID=A0AAV9GT83_9PEZI|nr:hypothetical protein QBC34DRAFT_399149 [Podospora aff. communis PSN243]